MRFGHPVWLVGFRSFFVAAMVSGAGLPLLWGLALVGLPAAAPAGRLSPMQWHAHEMLFGFGWAVLGGFLLTATKNWVKIRGYHGATLAALLALWGVDRLTLAASGALPGWLFWLGTNAFLVAVGALLVLTLVRHRKSDSFPDNFYFVGALPLFVLAKNLLLSERYGPHGVWLTVGLFRLAMVVMLERTVVQFMRAQLKTEIAAPPWMNHGIKGLTALLVFELLFPWPLAAALCALLATALLVRWFLWRPAVAAKRLDVGIMYVGYAGLVAHLFLRALERAGLWSGLGTLSLHAFTVGCMGIIIPAMLVRISLGHTGRPIAFTVAHKAALWMMMAGALLRLVLTQLDPPRYTVWLFASAALWAACFGVLAVRLTPFLLQARVDGKEH